MKLPFFAKKRTALTVSTSWSTSRITGQYHRNLQFSNNYGDCVGVGKDGNTIAVTNTNNENPIVKFTMSEWNAFLKGVKAGEFDEFLL